MEEDKYPIQEFNLDLPYKYYTKILLDIQAIIYIYELFFSLNRERLF